MRSLCSHRQLICHQLVEIPIFLFFLSGFSSDTCRLLQVQAIKLGVHFKSQPIQAEGNKKKSASIKLNFTGKVSRSTHSSSSKGVWSYRYHPGGIMSNLSCKGISEVVCTLHAQAHTHRQVAVCQCMHIKCLYTHACAHT